MNQPAAHPHHVANLFEPVLGNIVTALADRGRPDAQYLEKSAETWAVIQSFQPRDAIDLLLTGQLVAFNEVFADATRHLLRGMTDAMRQRTQSSLVAMGRLTLAHVSELAKRGLQPYQTELATDQRAAQTAHTPTTEPTEQPQAAAVPAPRPTEAPSPEPTPPVAPPVEEASWLDEPYREWVVENPAARAAARGEPIPPGKAPTAIPASGRGPANPAPAAPTQPEPLFPRQDKVRPHPATMAAASGD